MQNSGGGWQGLSRHGAHTQRLLWASTGTKSPNHGEVVYFKELIGPDPVNTMPPAILDAFCDDVRDHCVLP